MIMMNIQKLTVCHLVSLIIILDNYKSILIILWVNTNKRQRAPKKPKNRFGRYCKILRRKLGMTMTEAASLIGYSQSYLTQLENGTEKLTSESFLKCFKGYTSADDILIQTKLKLMYEMLECVETIEIDLSSITIIHRENLLRLFAELLLNETYPPGEVDYNPWYPVSAYITGLKNPPPKTIDILRLVSKKDIE